MTKVILRATVLILLCAGLMPATAALSRTGGVSAEHGLRITHQSFADLRATAPEPPTVFPSRRPQPYPYNFHETDWAKPKPK